jgi:peptidoglycan/LPS O-acetylase OafA/YrhL
MVTACHAQFGMNGTWFGGHPWIVVWGRHGVGVFFVLSGYLITSRLLREEKINLARFYVRRFFRLMPVAWTYLAVIIALTATFGVHVSRIGLFGCLLFFFNYLGHQTNTDILLQHFWSLSIEEQFYLVWPATLLLLGRKRSLVLSCFAFATLSIYGLFNWQAYLDASYRTEFNAHGLLAGCILALTIEKFKDWVARFAGILLVISVAGVVWHIWHYLIATPLESILIAVMMAATSAAPTLAFSRVLQWRPLAYLGTISYSLYVWQEMFLLPHLQWIGVALVLPTAVLSYAFIERPGIEFGSGFVRRRALASSRADSSAAV